MVQDVREEKRHFSMATLKFLAIHNALEGCFQHSKTAPCGKCNMIPRYCVDARKDGTWA